MFLFWAFTCTSRSRRQASELELELQQILTRVTTKSHAANFRTLILVLLATLAAVDTETVLQEPSTVAEFKKQRQLSRGGKVARLRTCYTFPGVNSLISDKDDIANQTRRVHPLFFFSSFFLLLQLQVVYVVVYDKTLQEWCTQNLAKSVCREDQIEAAHIRDEILTRKTPTHEQDTEEFLRKLFFTKGSKDFNAQDPHIQTLEQSIRLSEPIVCPVSKGFPDPLTITFRSSEGAYEIPYQVCSRISYVFVVVLFFSSLRPPFFPRLPLGRK